MKRGSFYAKDHLCGFDALNLLNDAVALGMKYVISTVSQGLFKMFFSTIWPGVPDSLLLDK
jgi:hypothetical protein